MGEHPSQTRIRVDLMKHYSGHRWPGWELRFRSSRIIEIQLFVWIQVVEDYLKLWSGLAAFWLRALAYVITRAASSRLRWSKLHSATALFHATPSISLSIARWHRYLQHCTHPGNPHISLKVRRCTSRSLPAEAADMAGTPALLGALQEP